MCHFITLLLPKGTDPDSVARACGRGEHAFSPIQNVSILAQAASGDRYFRASRGICDCGTSLGAATRRGERVPLDEGEAADRLRKKGWGEARVARWLAEKRRARDQQEANDTTRIEDAARYAVFWVDFLRNALTSGYTPRLTLLVHWYRDGVETEFFPALANETVPLSQVTPEFLTHLEEDTLYHFVVG